MAGTDSKLRGLDEPWVTLNPEVRSAFRIDLDHSFPSWEALGFELEQLPLPCLPHIVVGFEDENGMVERPHAVFLLPYNGGVWFSEDPRCQKHVMSLWRAVHAGITKALISLGADPGALSNPLRIKNPLSPFWSYRTWNETAFPNLSEWADWVDTSTNRDAMIRESAAALAGTNRKASNVLFNTFQQWSYETLRDLDRTKDPAYVGAVTRKDSEALAEMLFRTLVGSASAHRRKIPGRLRLSYIASPRSPPLIGMRTAAPGTPRVIAAHARTRWTASPAFRPGKPAALVMRQRYGSRVRQP